MDPILLINDHGIILSLNQPAADLFGASPQEQVGADLASLLSTETGSAAIRDHPLFHGQPVQDARFILRAASGLPLAIHLYAVPLLGADGAVSALSVTIVEASMHHHYRPVADLQLSILRATIESTADAILVIDKSMQVVTCNRKFEEMWGLPSGWAALPEYKNLLSALKQRVKEPEEFGRRVQEIYRQQINTGFELFEMLDGRVIERFSSVYTLNGEIGGRVWNYRDRTERERAQYELRTLKALAETFNRAVTPSRALQDGLAMVAELLQSPAGWIWSLGEPPHPRLAAAYNLPAGLDLSPGSDRRYPMCACLQRLSSGDLEIFDSIQCPRLAEIHAGSPDSPVHISIPIHIGERPAGVLNLLLPSRRAADQAARRLFEAISDQFGVALQRAALFAAEQEQRKAAEALYKVASALNTIIDAPAVLQSVVQLSVEVLSASGGSLGMLTPGRQELALGYSCNFDPALLGGALKKGAGLSWEIIEQGRPLCIDHYAAHPHCLPEILQLGIHAVIGAPVVSGSECLGVLLIFSTDPHKYFTPRQVSLLEAIGKQAGAAIHNALLFNEVQTLAITDPLTGLYNRRYLLTAGGSELVRACRYNHPLSVLMLDIDHFKRVNDTYGHPAGDAVLRAIAELCKTQLRVADITARYGGEEFAMLLVETFFQEALAVAERLRAAIEQTPIHTPQGIISVTASLGVAALDPDQPDPHLNDLLQRADLALYQAKQSGRNRVMPPPPHNPLPIP